MNDILDKYKEVKALSGVDIIHIYPKEKTGTNGIVHSRFFEVVGFNTVSMRKVNLGKHDDIVNMDAKILPVKRIQVFEDKSTLIKFDRVISCEMESCQTLCLGD